MKRITLLSLVLALFASTLSAESVEVTTTEMNVATPGSLLYVIENAATETTIEFNFDGEELTYGDGIGMTISGKKFTLNGVNKKNGKRVIISGTKSLFSLSGSAELTLNDLVVTGFKEIAIKLSSASIITDRCLFTNNTDLKNTGGNNGGVMRISASKAVLKNSVFTKNKGTGGYGGGAVCVYGLSDLRVENCSFIENVAASGGAIGVNVLKDKGLAKVYIANSTFANNIVDDRGGALYMQTAEISGAFAPVIVNCTFVGNLGKDGGAVCVWSRATTTMQPVFINNLFAENYGNAWMDNEANFDVLAFYMGGELDVNNVPLAQTVIPTCKNNLYVSASNKFFADATNKMIDFGKDNIFKAIEKNPLDEGDDYFNHKTSKLEGELLVAMIAENSIAKGAGIAQVAGVEVPTKDQLGSNRPAAPSVGAVEYGIISGILKGIANEANVKVWNVGNQLFVNGVEGNASVSVYDLAGKEIYNGTIDKNSSASLHGVTKGIYIAKVKSPLATSTAKIIID